MAATTKNNSDPVHIRYKEIAGGRKSIYLDYRVDGKRKVEYLRMYLQPGTSKEAVRHNEFTMRAVMNIKAERLKNFARKKDINAGVDKSKMFLLDWIEVYIQSRKLKGVRSADTCYQPLKKHIGEYAPKTRLWEVNYAFLKGFVEHMCSKICPRNKRNYSKKTVSDLVDGLGVVMKAAISEGIAVMNPVEVMDRSIIQGDEKPRSFLTVEEVKKLMGTPTTNERMKQLFLFSCMTGLRYSDLKTLTWTEIIEEDGKFRIEKNMMKTRRMLYLPMNDTAIKLLPPRKPGRELVFEVPTIVALDKSLKKWMRTAGIEKNVSFHTVRHTIATLAMAANADISTVRDILGQKSTVSTQVYAKVSLESKMEVVNLTNGLFD